MSATGVADDDEGEETDPAAKIRAANQTFRDERDAAFEDTLFTVITGATDRAKNAVTVLQGAATALLAIYTGLLGFVYSATGEALPLRAIITPVFLGLAVGAGSFSLVLLYNLITSYQLKIDEAKRPEDTVMVIVAARDLYQGVTVTEEDLYAVQIPPKFLPEGVFLSPSTRLCLRAHLEPTGGTRATENGTPMLEEVAPVWRQRNLPPKLPPALIWRTRHMAREAFKSLVLLPMEDDGKLPD